MIKFHNTLTNKKEEFVPINEKKVKMTYAISAMPELTLRLTLSKDIL